MLADFSVGQEHFIVGPVEDVVLQDCMVEMAGSRCAHPGYAAEPMHSSVVTEKCCRLATPKEIVMATSEASRPTAIRTLPTHGWLCRASKVHQRSSRYT